MAVFAGKSMKPALSGTSGADIASGRAAFYDLLVAVFRRLPDSELLSRIERGDFQDFLVRCCELDSGKMHSGLDLLNSYQSGIRGRPADEVIQELAVDRTRIVRGTGHPDLKPPYEGLYKGKRSMGDTVLEVTRFFRKSGLMPDGAIGEAPDYLCVELDFMKQLCLKEQGQWLAEGSARETVTQEEEFLKEHLGRWAGAFCREVERHAFTDFYKGFSLILEAFLVMDLDWLGRLSRQMQ